MKNVPAQIYAGPGRARPHGPGPWAGPIFGPWPGPYMGLAHIGMFSDTLIYINCPLNSAKFR